ncbi:hypothetical protein ACIGZJ_31250 [Kitasatospora sp. NPDC052868]|uniref:hypothetical protein n=1 Tax=Kitasatospora sp. NPDC052868 TaxID=3364060 RepID=UPI0037C962C3
MPLPPLATQTDLEDALQRTLDPTQAAAALRRASAKVRGYCRQELTFHAQDTIEIPGGTRHLLVPQRPLVVDADNPLTITELAGTAGIELPCLEGRDYTRLGPKLTRAEAYWQPTRLMGWPRTHPQGIWADRIRLTYSHGYTTVPDDILDIVVDLATMTMTNPQGLRSESIDDYSRTFASETIGAGTLTPDHRRTLNAYRLSPAYSVAPTR